MQSTFKYSYSCVNIEGFKNIKAAKLRWDGSHSAEVNENINLGYSQDQGYS